MSSYSGDIYVQLYGRYICPVIGEIYICPVIVEIYMSSYSEDIYICPVIREIYMSGNSGDISVRK